MSRGHTKQPPTLYVGDSWECMVLGEENGRQLTTEK